MGWNDTRGETTIQQGPEKEETLIINLTIPFFGKDNQKERFAQKILQAVRLSVHAEAMAAYATYDRESGTLDWTPVNDKELHKL